MVKDAEAHADEDKQAREAADARNQADQLVYQVDKTLEENKAKISEQDRAEVNAALQEAKQALERGEIERIKTTSENLEKAMHKLAELIYRAPEAAQQAAGAGAAGSATSGSGTDSAGEGEVIDAEVVDSEQSKH